MYEDLSELARKNEKTRKNMKDLCMRHEKTMLEAEVAAEKAKVLYNKLCEEMERLKDPSKGKFRLTNKNPAKTAAQEQELQVKITSAESDYRQKVASAQRLRAELQDTLRPGYVKELQTCILDCDDGVSAQLLKYASLNETLQANTMLLATPKPDQGPSLSDIAAKVNNPLDFYNDILNVQANSKKPINRQGVQFVQHAYMGGAPTTLVPDIPTMVPAGYASPSRSPSPVRSTSPMRATPAPSVAPSYYEADLPKSKVYEFGSLAREVHSLTPTYMGTPLSSAATARQNGYILPAFGTPLDAIIAYEALPDPLPVPRVVRECVTAIDQFGLDMEGIYRHSGPASQIQILKHLFDTDAVPGHGSVDLSQPARYGITDIHAVSGTLKQYFLELPDPLLGRTLHGEFLAAARIENDYRRRDAIHNLVNHLPDNNYTVLRFLSFHLDRVARHEALNRMGLVNLGNMWGGLLMVGSEDISEMALSARVVECIIENCEQMFEAQ